MTDIATKTTVKDLGNGWTRQGNDAIWAGEPRTADVYTFRDLLRLSVWCSKKDKSPRVLRIEAGDLEDGDPADREAVDDALETSIDLPIAALSQLADMLVRILGTAAVLDVITRINDERDEYLERLFNAAGRNPDATLGEAEAALKAQESSPERRSGQPVTRRGGWLAAYSPGVSHDGAP